MIIFAVILGLIMKTKKQKVEIKNIEIPAPLARNHDSEPKNLEV